MRFSWRGRSEDAAVVFQDRDGNPLPNWRVRAGTLISRTEYTHSSGTITCTVVIPPREPQTVESAVEHIRAELERETGADRA